MPDTVIITNEEVNSIITVIDNGDGITNVNSQPDQTVTINSNIGAPGPPGAPGTGDLNYIHTQVLATTTWNITHGLNKYPSVTIVDSGNSVIIGDIDFIDQNNIIISFSAAFSGKAYIN